ncbi:hypothetical protein NDU88_000911 [Pleurodeles waltl]|uniref:Uncharacterized protein n=1 Tax=Pleurodeles waltl TaxID=8319 RepID=A0AAV7L885_PLEWA|nr:hypothetical protein NDU88_000911 [Pleurodeles waltl]
MTIQTLQLAEPTAEVAREPDSVPDSDQDSDSNPESANKLCSLQDRSMPTVNSESNAVDSPSSSALHDPVNFYRVSYATPRPRRDRRLALFPGQRRRRNLPREPDRTEREDGLRLRREEDEHEQNAENAERRETDDGRRHGKGVAPPEITGQLGKEKNGDTRAFRHTPGGTWLTKSPRSQTVYRFPVVVVVASVIGTSSSTLTCLPKKADPDQKLPFLTAACNIAQNMKLPDLLGSETPADCRGSVAEDLVWSLEHEG